MNGPFQDRELDEEEEDEWRIKLAERKAMLGNNSALESMMWNTKIEIMGRMMKKGYADKEIAEILELNAKQIIEMKREL
ncbi:hypothetical protein [Planococcus shixiaomingii]|uniref:hypothetical protein n=1 Tax=Planococcus shixiaomingii TaxID=3058393 RepID=UPI002625344E|nr:hypothetical protein [Planococcus sp. N022]WKA56552.1 hypothetical protein QWY21_09450 [Planococcus sp. N022]